MDCPHNDRPAIPGIIGTVSLSGKPQVGKVLIGTSGWQYPDFSERFYPDDLEKTGQLGYYAEQFPTVEVNNSFYQLPKQETIKSWVQLVPKGFIFSVKASRYITHMKNLLEPESTLPKFYNRMAHFGDQCGPVLYQLPQYWKLNLDRLKDFLLHLSNGFRHAIEFRNKSWLGERVYELLRQHNVAFCIYDFDTYQSPILITTDFAYVRLHGPGRAYHDPYDLESLHRWAARIRAWCQEGRDVFCYFDNTHRGYAWKNAQTLISLLQMKTNSQ